MNPTKTLPYRLAATLIVAMTVLAGAPLALAQAANDIIAVDPDSAERGTTALPVTFTLDSDNPPPLPAGMLPDSATIGTIEGSSLNHDSLYTVT
ncbi:MAG: hypothetical protein GY906_29635, partial [bacterium]|nr:hypothetical protein [bacterium]